jgi:Fibronectin type III-like domain
MVENHTRYPQPANQSPANTPEINRSARAIPAIKATREPGESKPVSIELGFRELSMWDARMRRVVEPGAFTVMVGGNQRDVLEETLEVIGDTP